MADYEWMTAFYAVLREIETPEINLELNGRTVGREEPDLQVLAKPAVRETEILVYSGEVGTRNLAWRKAR
jgi:hypothetical protein